MEQDFYGNSRMFYMALQSLSEGQNKADLFHDNHLDLHKYMRDLVAFHADMMGDIIYFHQAIKQPYAWKFAKAIAKEIEAYIKDSHWKLVKWSEVPPDTVLPYIWAMHKWQNLTSWVHMESIYGQKNTQNWICTVSCWWMCDLVRWHHFHHVHQWQNVLQQ